MKEEFKLPEKWCIRDCKEVSEYSAKINGSDEIPIHNMFYHEWRIDDKMQNYKFIEFIDVDFTEITLEQFQRYVLGELIFKEPEEDNMSYLKDFLNKLNIT